MTDKKFVAAINLWETESRRLDELAERVNSLEKNVAGHEKQLGELGLRVFASGLAMDNLVRKRDAAAREERCAWTYTKACGYPQSSVVHDWDRDMDRDPNMEPAPECHPFTPPAPENPTCSRTDHKFSYCDHSPAEIVLDAANARLAELTPPAPEKEESDFPCSICPSELHGDSFHDAPPQPEARRWITYKECGDCGAPFVQPLVPESALLAAEKEKEKLTNKILRQADHLFKMQRKMHTIKGDLLSKNNKLAAAEEENERLTLALWTRL